MKELSECSELEVANAYRNVFGTLEGNRVLQHIFRILMSYNVLQANTEIEAIQRDAMRTAALAIAIHCGESQESRVKGIFREPIQIFEDKENEGNE